MQKFAFLLLTIVLSSCGYNLRGNTRVFFEQNNIERLYVNSVKNNSYQPGIEIVVYNALRKRIAQGGYVKLVDRPEGADAIIDATVNEATNVPGATSLASQLTPLNKGSNSVLVASSYTANLIIKFALRTVKGKPLWSDQLARSKTYQANTYLGTLGSTSPLINQSEFEKTLGELSVGIVTDAEESMNTVF